MRGIILAAALVYLTGCGNADRSTAGSQTIEMTGFERAAIAACKRDSDCPLYHVCANGRCYAN